MVEWKKKHTRRAAFGILIFFVIVLFWSLYQITPAISYWPAVYSGQNDKIINQSNDKSADSKKYTCPENPLYCKALQANPRLQECNSYQDDYRYFCAALMSNDPAFCNLSENPDNRIHCLAYNTKSAELCSDHSDSDFCYFDLAINWKMAGLCEKVKESGFSELCRVIVMGVPGACHSLNRSDY